LPAGNNGYPPAACAWYAVIVCYLAYTLAFIDRIIVSFLVGPIRADFAITDFQFSLISGLAFALFYATLGIPIARLADTRNRRNIIAIGISCWSLMTAACGLAANYWQLFLARLGVGVGEAALSPAAISMISDYFPRDKRTLPINVYSAGVQGGAGLANIFGGMVVGFTLAGGGQHLLGLGEFKPWQLAFVLVGLPGLLVAACMFSVREPARREQRQPESGTRFIDTLRYLRRHGVVYATLIIGAALSATASYGTFSWVPALFERRYAWDSAAIGMSFGLITLTLGTAGLILSGLAANAMLKIKISAPFNKLMIATMGCAIPPAALLVAVRDPHWTLCCLALMVFLLSAPIGLVQAALQAITPNEMRAQVIAIYLLTVTIIGLAAGPSLVAAVTDFHFRNDAAVGSSIAVVATTASIISLVILAFGISAYKQKAAHPEEPGAPPTTAR
jgi:MFS family permease